MASLLIDDFSGGLNLRDSINELAPNETPNARNLTLDERGALNLRNGCFNASTLPGLSGANAWIHYSEALDLWLCARSSAGTLHLFSAPGTAMTPWTDRGTINSVTTAMASFIDFPGFPPKVVITTDVISGATKGIWTFDGAFTLTNVSTTVAGSAIALWQDKAWVCGYPTSDANGNPTRLFYCLAKDPTAWNATTQFIDVREKDAAPLTALGVVAGALISFKKRSAYRHNDSSTGEFAMLDSGVGAAGARCVVAHTGRLYAWSTIGLYEFDGIGSGRNVGDKIRPLFTSNATTTCGGVLGSRLLFAFDEFGQGEPHSLMEFRPSEGWLLKHYLAASGFDEVTSFALKGQSLYGAVKDGNAIFQMFAGSVGQDDGQLVLGQWQTPWFLPNSGMLARLHRLRIQGLVAAGTAALNVTVYKDWVESGDLFALGDLLRASGGSFQRTADIQSLGHAASFAFFFATATAAGATSLRAIQLIDQTLQWPNPGYPHGQVVGDRGRGGPPPAPVPAQ